MQITIDLNLDIPANLLNETIHQQAEQKARESYVMELLRHGTISTGYAATLLNLSRLDILERIGQYQISPFPEQSSEELAQEIAETTRLFDSALE